MLDRFKGTKNKGTRVDAIKRQRLVADDDRLAKLIEKKSRLRFFKPDDILISQDDSGDDLFLLLAGSVTIVVNRQGLSIRERGEHVGEMAIINPGEPRSASVVAREPTVVAILTRKDFESIADRHPTIWRRVAVVLAERLKQRNNLVRSKNENPIIFIGSAKESLPLVRQLKRRLDKVSGFIVRGWTDDDVFKPSRYTIEDLFAQLLSSDFALFVFGPDDRVF